MKLIDKAAVVAEINRRIKEIDEIGTYLSPKGTLTNLLCFLDTTDTKEVEEEPVSNDLEEAIKKYLKSLRKSHFEGYDIERAFKKGAKWQKEQMIDKACEWLIEHKEHPFIGCEDPCLSGYLTDEFIEDFKKAMEE